MSFATELKLNLFWKARSYDSLRKIEQFGRECAHLNSISLDPQEMHVNIRGTFDL